MIKLTTSSRDLVTQAEQEITALSPSEVKAEQGKAGVVLVDLRDIRELQHEGKIASAMHVPRGMLEFWIDPDSPYYRKEFDQVESLILFCNKGWRSALAAKALQDMGVEQVKHMQGGFTLWAKEIGEIEQVEHR
ncbi:MAG: rhodanese-like domain-containing protein [Arenicellales bacterium]